MGGQRDPLAQFGGETGKGPIFQSDADGDELGTMVTMPTFGAAQHRLRPYQRANSGYLLNTVPHASPAGNIDMPEFGVAK